MFRRFARPLLVIAVVFGATVALAHDSWISRGGLRGVGPAAGEWCCGDGDCAMLAPNAVHIRSDGYEVDGYGTITFGDRTITERYKEVVPESEIQPSPDGAFWRCKRPDGSRRCFFAPPQGS